MQTEAERDWETDEDKWTIPIGPFVSKLLDIGGQKISFQRGPLWCAGELDKSPDWSLRLKAVFPFPKQALGAAANMRDTDDWRAETGLVSKPNGRARDGHA